VSIVLTMTWTRQIPKLLAPLLRSRLLHFFALGALCFAVAPRDRGRRVDIPAATLTALRSAEARRTSAPLDEPRAREVDARAIEDEILYREALRMSLDKGDPLVRQRLIEKLLLLVEDMGGASRAPSDAELRAYFDETRAKWRRADRVHFLHVFAARKDSLPKRDALDPEARDAPAAGEPFPYARDVTTTREEIVRLYGTDLADELERQDGAWSDPVASSFGWHRVRVVGRMPGAPARFEDVKKEIELDFVLARREKVVGAYLQRLSSQYDIRVDGKPVDGYVPTRRVALRADPSAED
jgi:hypothetical protein